jgi:DNA-directed RNA polymerase subunit alpha
MVAVIESIESKIRLGQIDQARKDIRALPDTPENRAHKLFLEGYVQEYELDRDGALSLYQRALDEDPDHVEASFRGALLCDQGGDEDAALELYERCTSSSPAPINALYNLAVIYEDAGRLGDAEAILKAILDHDPNHARAKQLQRSVESGFHMVIDEQSQRDRDKRNAMLDTPITDFELSVRSRNCLRQMNIRTIGDLLRTTEAELLSYKNFGETSLNEIKALLGARGVRLGQSLQPVEPPQGPLPPQVSNDASIHLRRPVSELELSVRSRKALMRLGVTTLADLMLRSEAELLSIKNFGQTSLNEIKRQLQVYGLNLRAG